MSQTARRYTGGPVDCVGTEGLLFQIFFGHIAGAVFGSAGAASILHYFYGSTSQSGERDEGKAVPVQGNQPIGRPGKAVPVQGKRQSEGGKAVSGQGKRGRALLGLGPGSAKR